MKFSYKDPSFILVTYTGPRGGAREVGVRFDRKGVISHGIDFTNNKQTRLAPEDIPPDVTRVASSARQRALT